MASEARLSIASIFTALHDDLKMINETIHQNPELCFKEFIAHNALCEFLERHGFAVTRSAHGLETCLEARWPPKPVPDSPLVTFCAEYDALPGIGHACGHNLIATSSVAAFMAVANTLENSHSPGQVRLLGTPAEEGGGGKVILVEAGAFRGFDISRPEIAVMAHPVGLSSFQEHEKLPPSTATLAGFRCIACEDLRIEYFGRAAHAGGEPWLGRNALDATVMAYTALSQLRQHIRSDERVGAIINHGGEAPGIIPAYASLLCTIRAPTKMALEDISRRVHACAAGAAQMAGCDVKVETTEPTLLDLKVVDAISQVYAEEMTKVEAHSCRTAVAHTDVRRTVSTDMGNVSHVVPSFHGLFGIPSPDNVSCHNPGFTAAACTDQALEHALRCARGMSMLAWRFITEATFRQRVSEEFANVESPAIRH